MYRIIADPKNPALYTNRAMARLKLGYWDSVVTDCEACLALAPSNMKAHYYLSQAQLSVGDYDSALDHARQAHEICAATNDKSLAAVTAIVLRCKKERWEHKEKHRAREAKDLEHEVMDLLARDRDEMLAGVTDGDEIEKTTIREETDAKMGQLKLVFERARAESEKRREVPEWAIDDISFGVMVDPVIVSSIPLRTEQNCSAWVVRG